MIGMWKTATAMVALVATASAAQAQECEIPETGDVAKATFTLTRARSSQDAQEAVKQLRNAVKMLTNKPEKLNPAGRNFVLGQAYVEFAKHAAPTYSMQRSEVGLSDQPSARIDLLAAADSAFDAVVQLKPECKAQIAQYRQQQAWLDLINAGVNALNAGRLDSAEKAVRRSMVLYDESPYAYHLLASVAQNRANYQQAIDLRKKTLEVAGKDTSYREVRTASLLNLGVLTANIAADTTGPAQRSYARESAQALRAFLEEAPKDEGVVQAQQTLARVLVLSGDTTSMKGIYAAQLANPSEYSDLELVNAGVIAAQANQASDAVVLFEAALKNNPYHRDALYNLAASLYAREQFQEMLPVVKRLIEIDPSNPENLRLYAFAYQGLSKAAKSEQLKRTQTDSIVKYYEMSEKMPVKVSFSQFTRGTEKVTLAGSVENRGSAAKTYQLKIEFLDRTGAVVATETATVGPVAPNAAGTFSVTAQKPNVTGFRYAPVS